MVIRFYLRLLNLRFYKHIRLYTRSVRKLLHLSYLIMIHSLHVPYHFFTRFDVTYLVYSSLSVLKKMVSFV